MTYHNAVKYLQQAPVESQETASLSLLSVWDALGAPQRNFKYLRLTGSNGKTVCAELLISAFRDSEYIVGSLSIPMRSDGRENVRINSLPLSPDEFAVYTERIFQVVKELSLAQKDSETESSDEQSASKQFQLSQSQLLLTIALLAFREHRCTFCLIESDSSPTDPTRRLPAPFAAAICGTIPSDNPKEIQQIRSYISHGIQEIVSAPQNQESYRVISETCAAINCRLTIPTKTELVVHRSSLGGNEFSYKDTNYRLSLCGSFQITNATVVLELIDMLARRGYSLSPEQILRGFSQTKIPAKFEILSVSPTIIVDSTHSETAVQTVCEALSDFQRTLGNKLRLCLPSSSLSEQYLRALSPYGYSIDSFLLYEDTEKPKDIAAKALDGLQKDETLLISGPGESTVKIRHEILKKLSK